MNEPNPTDAELQILQVLWADGPRTVRQVHRELAGDHAYTTTLKTMQRMADKGLVERDVSQRSHVYRATSGAESTTARMVGNLADKVFAGSAARLAMRALSTRRASAEEIEAIRHLLDELEADR